MALLHVATATAAHACSLCLLLNMCVSMRMPSLSLLLSLLLAVVFLLFILFRFFFSFVVVRCWSLINLFAGGGFGVELFVNALSRLVNEQKCE